MENTNNGCENLMWCSDFCVDGDDVWMAHGGINAIVHYNMKTCKTRFLTSVPGIKILGEFLYIRIIKHEQKLVLIPCHAEYLVVYDLDKNKFICKHYMKDIYNTISIFSDACICDNVVYCIPSVVGNPILKLDMNCLSSFQLVKLSNGKFNGKNINHGCICNQKIYCVMPQSACMIQIDIRTERISYIDSGCKFGFSGIAAAQNRLFLQNIEQNILLVWDEQKQEVTSKFKVDSSSGAICTIDQTTVWVDTNDEYAIIINITNGNTRRYYKFNQTVKKCKTPYFMGPAYRVNEKFYYYNRAKSSLVQFYNGSWKETEVREHFTSSNEFVKNITDEIQNGEDVIYESCYADLNKFLDAVIEQRFI